MTAEKGKLTKYALASVGIVFVLFVVYSVSESRKHPVPIGEIGSTVVMSGERPYGKTSGESQPIEWREMPTTRYPWCDTDDILLPDGSQKWSACNVGATKASAFDSCYEQKELCDESIAGKYFKWWRNEPYDSGSTMKSATWANAWWGVTDDPLLRRGPCEEGYHVPSQSEVEHALSVPISPQFDQNEPWRKSYEFTRVFRWFLKIPHSNEWLGYSSDLRQNRGYSRDTFLWTRNLSNDVDHPPVGIHVNQQYFKECLDKKCAQPSGLWSGFMSAYAHNSRFDALPVRCIKDDLYSE